MRIRMPLSVDEDGRVSRETAIYVEILQASMAMGTIIFGGVVFGVHAVYEERLTGGRGMMGMLSGIHAGMAATLYLLAWLVPEKLLSPQRMLAGADDLPELRDRALHYEFQSRLVRLAMVEGVGLFGLVVCLMGVLSGSMDRDPIYWLNMATPVVHVGFVVATLATRSRLQRGLDRRLREVRELPEAASVLE